MRGLTRYSSIRSVSSMRYKKTIPKWFKRGCWEYKFALMLAMEDTLGRIRRFRRDLLWEYWVHWCAGGNRLWARR